MTVQPLALALLLIAAGLWAPRNRMLRRVSIAAWIGLFLWSWAPVSWLTSGSLEWRYPISLVPSGDAEAIVVLSANVLGPNASRPEAEADRNTYVRCRYAAWLYHHWRAVPIIAAGGRNDQGVAIAPVMRHVLESEGVPPEQISVEDTSTTTYENARNSAVLLRARGIGRIVLVTEAYHMLRSDLSFRKQGLTVLPAPFGYRTLSMGWSLRDWRRFIPNTGEELVNNDNLHEWVGLAWYRLSGKI